VLLMIPPPLYLNSTNSYPFNMNNTVINDILPSLIREIGQVAEVDGFIDIHTAIMKFQSSQTTAKVTCDGCHPNPVASDEIANVLAPAIHEASKRVASRHITHHKTLKQKPRSHD